MAHVTIRQAGGAKIISIPQATARELHLEVGTKLELTIQDNKIILSPPVKMSLTELLDGSPIERLKITEEDQEWMAMKTAGSELI